MDYSKILIPGFRESATLLKSNFMTWGIVNFDGIIRYTQKNTYRFPNLLGYFMETGKEFRIPSLNSCILEMFVNESLDFMAFTSPDENENLTGFFRLSKINHVMRNLDVKLTEWLFNESTFKDHNARLNTILYKVFMDAHGEEIERLLEIIEDIGEMKNVRFNDDDLFEIFLIIFYEFWDSFEEEEQWQMINKWPQISHLYELCERIENNFPKMASHIQEYLVELDVVDIKNIETPHQGGVVSADSAENLFLKAVEAYQMGDMATASKIFEEIDENMQDSLTSESLSTFSFYKTSTHFNLEEWDDALKSLEIFKHNCDDSEQYYRFRRGLLLLLLGKEKQFISEFESLCKEFSLEKNMMTKKMRHFYRDIILVKKIHFMEELLEKLIKRGKVNVTLMITDIGSIVTDLGYFEEGKAFFEEGLTIARENSHKGTLLNNIGSILVETGKNDEAIPILKESIDIWPENARTYTNLAKAYSFIGENIKAVEIGEKARKKVKKGDSFAEVACTHIELDSMDPLVSLVINYHSIQDKEVVEQFRLGDQLFNSVFPENENLHKLATSIIHHYANGMELLFHEELGVKMKELVERQIQLRRNVPKQLLGLSRGHHVTLGAWAHVFGDFIQNPGGRRYRRFKAPVSHFSMDDLTILKDSVSIVNDWRNKSDHAESINYNTVLAIRGKLVYSINRVIESLNSLLKNKPESKDVRENEKKETEKIEML
ncbi:MAG: tetratricopeptide repeat protein [Candidatus Hodarchaeota archaeon]